MDYIPVPRQAALVLIHAFMRHGNGIRGEEFQAVDALSRAVYSHGIEPATPIMIEPAEEPAIEPMEEPAFEPAGATTVTPVDAGKVERE